MSPTLTQFLLSGVVLGLIVQACSGFYWGGKINAIIEAHEKRLDHLQQWIDDHDREN